MQHQYDLFPRSSQPSTVPSMPIEGMTYISQFLTSTEQTSILEEIDRHPWRLDLKRRVQHYGFRYDYKARCVDRSMRLGGLPQFALPFAARLVELSFFHQAPDQLIVNEYMPGQGISAHVDCEPCFGEIIAMVSLGWPYEMDFIHSATRERRSILLDVGSALIIGGDARYKWLHEIKARLNDRGVPRRRRISLTFRSVIVSDA